MSRLEEVNKKIEYMLDAPTQDECIVALDDLARTLAAEVDELRGKLADWEVAAQQGHPSPCTLGTLCPYCEIDRLRGKLDALRAEADPQALVICHMQGRAEGDAVITKLLGMLKDNEPGRIHGVMYYTDAQNKQAELYRRACEIAGRTE